MTHTTVAAVVDHWGTVGMSTAVATLDLETLAPTLTTTAHGTADQRTGEPMTPETRLLACSMSKAVTAVAMLRLVELGRLRLDSDVNELLTRWQLRRPEGSRVTVAHLLAHHGGITDAAGSFEPSTGAVPSNEDVLRGLTSTHAGEVVAARASGLGFEYSDAGFCVLEEVVSDVTGQPFAAAMAELVFDPLALTSTGYDDGPTAARTASPQGRGAGLPTPGSRAVGHDQHGAVVPGERPVYAAQAAAGLWTTPRDLAVIAADLLAAFRGADGHLLRPDTVATAWSGHFGTGFAGLGFFLGRDELGAVVQSHGWGVGFQGMVRIWPELQRLAVVQINQDPGCDQESSAVGAAVEALSAA